MAKKLIYSSLFLFLFCVLAGAAIYFYGANIYWKPLTTIGSPNSEFYAASYSYGSDGDRHAPYGTYIFLNRSIRAKNPINGYVVFAGYCKNEPTLSWQSDIRLHIGCKLQRKGIRTLASQAYGISIVFEQK